MTAENNISRHLLIMDPVVHLLVSVIFFTSHCNVRVIGNAVMIQPYFEVRQLPAGPFDGAHYVPMKNNIGIHHSTPQDYRQTSSIDTRLVNRSTYNTSEAKGLSKEPNRNIDDDIMKTARDADQAAASPYALHHQYEETASPSPSSSYVPSNSKDISTPTPTAKVPFAGIDFTALLNPTTAKIASKATGLMDLVLALLGNASPPNGEIKGFKELVVNGILRPLLVAKGGIKSLISKLTIPIISLILINLEVLVTVWWLWEDCPLPKPQPPTYSYPSHVSYNHNMSYR